MILNPDPKIKHHVPSDGPDVLGLGTRRKKGLYEDVEATRAWREREGKVSAAKRVNPPFLQVSHAIQPPLHPNNKDKRWTGQDR